MLKSRTYEFSPQGCAGYEREATVEQQCRTSLLNVLRASGMRTAARNESGEVGMIYVL